MNDNNYKFLFFIVLSILIGILSIATIFIIVNKTNKDRNSKTNISEIKKEKTKKDNQIEDIEREDNNNNEKAEDISTTNSYDDVTTTTKDDEVLSYLKLKSDEIDSKIEEKNYKNKVKQTFIEIIDFIFYDGKIKNHTFNELTNKAKIEVIKITLKIEDKIEEHYPGLIDSIGGKYSNIKSKLIDLYNNKVEDFCYEHNNLCAEVKDEYETIKKSLKTVFSKTKNKVSNFYQTKIKNN